MAILTAALDSDDAKVEVAAEFAGPFAVSGVAQPTRTRMSIGRPDLSPFGHSVVQLSARLVGPSK
jgi:hypothetical protein